MCYAVAPEDALMTAPRVLLLQARDLDDPMIGQERDCFVRAADLPDDHVSAHCLCQSTPSIAELRRHDAVMIGGSGSYYVTKGDLPDFERFHELLREIVAARQPMFASCFGYQSLVAALGGEVIYDPQHTEVGTYELTLTDAGRADPLFGSLPERFNAQMGRKDRATRHPGEWANLASSALCPLQGFRVPGAPIWASQFHPELGRASNLARYEYYLPGYRAVMSEEEIQATLERFQESPEASGLLRRFVELVIG